LLARSVAEDAPLEQVEAAAVRLDGTGQRFSLADGREVWFPVPGVHQATNAAIAIRAAELFLGRGLSAGELDALRGLELPARLERFGDVVLDSAHTPESARALRETLEQLYPGRSWVLGLSVARDKDAAGILRELAPATRVCVLTRAERTRSLETDALERLAADAGISEIESCDTPDAAVDRVRTLRRPGELVVLTGSIYFAGAIRARLCAPSRTL